MQKVSEETLSVYDASKKYDMPERTISWHLKEQQKRGQKKTGPENVFTEFEEEQLNEWLGVSSDLSDLKTKDDLIKAVPFERKFLKSSDKPQFKNGHPTEHWVKSFLKRNPGIVLRTPDSISKTAAVPASRIFFKKRFFDHFQIFFRKEWFVSCP